MDKHFIADHLELAEKGYFVCGSRVLLGRMATARLLRGVETHPALFKQDLSFLLNAFRSHTLRLYLANGYAKNSMLRIRGCNMAFWKEDLLKVNGYNEAITGWGSEDHELVCRLINNGVRKRTIKFAGIVFHLHHELHGTDNLNNNRSILNETKVRKLTWCDKGIIQN